MHLDLDHTRPTITLDSSTGRAWWCFADGTIVPVVSGGDGDPDPDPDPTPGFKPITSQEELDRRIGERLARERAKFDEAVEKARLYDEQQAANQTELERERTAREAAEKKATEAAERANSIARRAAILAAAGNAVDPETVADLIPAAQVTVDANGNVTGAAEAVAALLETKPFLAKPGTPPPGDPNPVPPNPDPTPGSKPQPGGADGGPRGGSPAGQLTRDDLKTMSPADIVQAKAEGRLDAVLGRNP